MKSVLLLFVVAFSALSSMAMYDPYITIEINSIEELEEALKLPPPDKSITYIINFNSPGEYKEYKKILNANLPSIFTDDNLVIPPSGKFTYKRLSPEHFRERITLLYGDESDDEDDVESDGGSEDMRESDSASGDEVFSN